MDVTVTARVEVSPTDGSTLSVLRDALAGRFDAGSTVSIVGDVVVVETTQDAVV
jgi:hypothetical protein